MIRTRGDGRNKLARLTGGNLWSREVCVGPGQPLNDGIFVVACRKRQKWGSSSSQFHHKMANSSVDTYRYRAGPGRCVLWLVWARCSCGMKSPDWNTQPDALECHSRRKPNTASVTIPRYRQEGREIPRLMVLWGTLWLKLLGGCGGNQFLFFFLKKSKSVKCHLIGWSYPGPRPSSPRGWAWEAVAGLFSHWTILATEFAGDRSLLLLSQTCRLLATHPAPLPPCLTTGGAAGLPLACRPAIKAEQKVQPPLS